MSKLKVILIAISLVLIGIGIKGYTLYQSVSPNPIAFWQDRNDDKIKVIDHQLWAELLTTYLSDDVIQNVRTFNYSMVTEQDKTKLHTYLEQLQQIDPRDYQKNEQLAYWANLYNALTIDVVLKHYPIDSIKDIGDGFTGPWNMELITIAGKPITLNQIEHGILRGLWKDNRIHYIINCASVGCPDLPSEPLKGANIEQQLDRAATRFINQSKSMTFDGNDIVLSSIYKWFSIDFGENDQQLLNHLSHYAKPETQAKIKTFEGDIAYDYNWELNAPN